MTEPAQETSRKRAFPLSWVTTGKHLLLIGGCDGRLCRLRTALEFDWTTITLIRQDCTEPLCADCPRDPRVNILQGPPKEKHIEAADLIIECTLCQSLGETVYRWAKKHHVPVSCMDKLDFCDFHYPALMMRGPLIIALLTGGTAPALSSRLRKELEEFIGPGWETAARLFKEKRESLPRGEKRNECLKTLANDPQLLDLIQKNDEYAFRQWMNTDRTRNDNGLPE